MKKIFSILLFLLIIITSLSLKSSRLGETLEMSSKPSISGLENIIGKEFLALTREILNPSGILRGLMEYRKVYLIPFSKPIIRPKWKRVPGSLMSLSAGHDGSILGIDNRNELFEIGPNNQFVKTKGMGKIVSVGRKNQICLLGKRKDVYRYNQVNESWESLKAKADYISCGVDGFLAVIHRSKEVEKWGIAEGSLSYYHKGTWLRLPGIGFKMIDVVKNNDIWGIRKDYSVWHWDGDSWKSYSGKMKYISAAPDGTVVGVGVDNGAYIWSGRNWINVRGVQLKSIEVVKNGYMLALSMNGQIWKSFQNDINEEFLLE